MNSLKHRISKSSFPKPEFHEFVELLPLPNIVKMMLVKKELIWYVERSVSRGQNIESAINAVPERFYDTTSVPSLQDMAGSCIIRELYGHSRTSFPSYDQLPLPEIIRKLLEHQDFEYTLKHWERHVQGDVNIERLVDSSFVSWAVRIIFLPW